MTELLPPLLLLGGGKMGGAMLAGWRERGLTHVIVIDPAMPDFSGPCIDVLPSGHVIPPEFVPAAIVLAVKPQMADAALPALARFAGQGVVVSIMAGRTLAGLQATLGGAVVRAMPNTPAAIRQGITVACAGPRVSAAQKALSHTLLASVGDVEWVEDEGLLDAVTAVSGGGPAYVFLLAELLEQAALAQGIPAKLARQLARRTVAGSGALLEASREDADVLRRNVTSPAGTTEQALRVLMRDDAWPALMNEAIEAATVRSRELAG